MSQLLSKDEWEILNCIELHHFRTGKFPALSTIAKKTKIDQVTVVESLSNPILQRSLDNRGIEWRVVQDDELTPKQLACIQLILNVTDDRSIKQKLQSLGIKPQTYYSWKRNPHFQHAYTQAARDLYGHSIPELHQTLIKRSLDGDLQSLKLALSISGEYDDKRSVEAMNVQFVLMKVLEVIQKHVIDKNTLNAIAGEFENIINPGKKHGFLAIQGVEEEEEIN